MDNENPYTHIWDFEEFCTTFKEGATDMELLKLKAFPLNLKNKPKIWLNSLRPRTIINWTEMQVEFLKKFLAHIKPTLKRGRFIPLQPVTMRSFTSAGRGI